MKKKIETICVICFLLIAGLALINPVEANDAKMELTIINSSPTGLVTIFYVDDDNTQGPWNGTEEHPFQNIQDAIDAAYKPGPGWKIWYQTRIIVKNGTYNEDIIINKTLILEGENKDITVINGSGSSNTVKIIAKGVIIKGFTIQNGGVVHPGAGVYVLAKYVQITDNIIKDNYEGIYITNFSNNCTINDNTINGRVTLDEANYNIISNNYITSTYEGLYFSKSNHNKIFKNTIENCNVYDNPNLCGVRLWSSSENLFYLNNFINNKNGNAIEENELNQWDNGVHGNYWDDYTGEDLDNDGIGDTPYLIDELDNQDNHPLVKPFEEGSFSVQIECENPLKQIFPGQTKSFEIKITNTGDILDVYDIKSYLWGYPQLFETSTSCIPPYVFVYYSADNVSVKPGETKIVYANATVFNEINQVLTHDVWAVSQTDESVRDKTEIYLDVQSVDVQLCINSGFNSPIIKIKNIGDANLYNIDYKISVKGFRRRSINVTHQDSLDNLYSGSEKTIRMPRGSIKKAFGFVTIKVELKENILGRNPLEKEYTFRGFCFGRYVKVLG